jgi:hypothetical protein
MTAQKAATLAIAIAVAIGLAGCGTVHGSRAHNSGRLISSSGSHKMSKVTLDPAARRFMRKVPYGDTGYPGLDLILAPAPARTVATPARTVRVMRLFYKLRVAQAILGKRLRSPEVTYWIITDYNPLPGMKPGAKFPAIVLTYRNIACEAYGPPSFHGPRKRICTTVAFYDLDNSRWLGIYQYNDHLSAIKKT